MTYTLTYILTSPFQPGPKYLDVKSKKEKSIFGLRAATKIKNVQVYSERKGME